MTTLPPTDSSAETIIRDLHLVREQLVNAFHGDLRALVADARNRQNQSGRAIWRNGQIVTEANNPKADPK